MTGNEKMMIFASKERTNSDEKRKARNSYLHPRIFCTLGIEQRNNNSGSLSLFLSPKIHDSAQLVESRRERDHEESILVRRRGRGGGEKEEAARAISQNRLSHGDWNPVWLMTVRAPITNKYSLPIEPGLLHYVLISDEHRPRGFPVSICELVGLSAIKIAALPS